MVYPEAVVRNRMGLVGGHPLCELMPEGHDMELACLRRDVVA